MDFVDSETNAMMNIATHLTLQQMSAWPRIRKIIMERCAMFEAGRQQAPRWIQKKLEEIDPLLHLRWDFIEGCYVVDRFTRVERAWVPVCVWKDENGPKNLTYELLETIQDGDMWRFPSYKEYLAYKRAKAERRRRENKYQSEQAVLAAIDKMSSKDIAEFTEVSTAIKAGESVEFHGNDEKYWSGYDAGARNAIAADYHQNRRI